MDYGGVDKPYYLCSMLLLLHPPTCVTPPTQLRRNIFIQAYLPFNRIPPPPRFKATKLPGRSMLLLKRACTLQYNNPCLSVLLRPFTHLHDSSCFESVHPPAKCLLLPLRAPFSI